MEENKVVNFEALKESLKNLDVNLSAEYLKKIYINKPYDFKKGLLLSECLIEPGSLGFDIEILNVFQLSYLKAAILIMNDISNIQMVDDFMMICSKLYKTIVIFNEHHSSNEKRSENCSFFKYEMAKQLQMICIFIEHQGYLAEKEIFISAEKRNVYSGVDTLLALPTNKKNKNVGTSAHDLLEGCIEIADELFRFIYYLSRKKINKGKIEQAVDVSPYEIPNVEEIIMLTQHRIVLKTLWGRVKYRNWDYQIIKNGNHDFFYYTPDNTENFKKETASNERILYREHIDVSRSLSNNQKVLNEVNESIEMIGSHYNLENITEIFNLKKEEMEKIIFGFNKLIDGQLTVFNETYVEAYEKIEIIDGITVLELVNCIRYLYSIASIYKQVSSKKINHENREEYKYFAPILKIDTLIKNFALIYDIDEKLAKKIMNLLVFRNKSATKGSVIDVFSQPLIFLSNEEIIFTPLLILQMNIPRIIETHVSREKIDVSIKGTRFEDSSKNLLKLSRDLKVNTNKIEFDAYDGKPVEYDFIAMFNNHIIIMEFKCPNAPYTDKEKNDKEHIMKEAVGQVERRVDVLKHNWKEITEMSSIKLPLDPPDDDKIIKIACLNIFNFSGRIEKGVFVTDYSLINKFFLFPEIQAIVIDSDKTSKMKVSSLWSDINPSVEEFKMYLKSPAAMHSFYNVLAPIKRVIPKIEEKNSNIAALDFYLEKNPFDYLEESTGKKNVERSNMNKNKKSTSNRNKIKKISKRKNRRK